MKKYLMLLSCAGMLTMASCSQDKPTETTTETTSTTTTTDASGSAAMGGYSDADYNSRADRIAGDMATKMKLDEATKAKVREAYYNRSKRLGELHEKYMSDTTGMAAAMRDVYSQTDTEMKTIFTDPTQYSAYETSRPDYYEDRYMSTTMSDGSSMDSTAMSSDMSSSGDMSGSASSSDMSTGTMKAKGSDGSKLKVKSDGDVKIKDGMGNKGKIDADDATVKEKPASGGKTVIK